MRGSLLITVLSCFVQLQAQALEIHCVDPSKELSVTITNKYRSSREDLGTIRVFEKNSNQPSVFELGYAAYSTGFLVLRATDRQNGKHWVQVQAASSSKTPSKLLWSNGGRDERFLLTCF